MDPALASAIDPNTLQTITLVAVIALAWLAGTHILSSLVRNLTKLHDTRVRVVELQNMYQRDLLRLKGYDVDDLGEVEIVEDEDIPQNAPASTPTSPTTAPAADQTPAPELDPEPTQEPQPAPDQRAAA